MVWYGMVWYGMLWIHKNTSAGEVVREWLLRALMKYGKQVDVMRRTIDANNQQPVVVLGISQKKYDLMVIS